MTVLTSDDQLVGTRTAALPRVNLLPPEIRQVQAFRRIQMGLGVAVLGTVGVVALLYGSASHSVTSAQSQVDRAASEQAQLNRQIKSYTGVTTVYAAAEAARQQLSTAMADEIRYSQLLNDISLSIPSNVWLESMSFTQRAPGAAAAGPAATVLPGAPLTVGQATFSGVAFSHDDVATWLEAMAGLKTYTNPYFSQSAEALIGTRPVVNWSGTTDIVPTAYSHRYDKPGA